jgi:ubiquinone/menaquinone biosynthesis C-methylase UbiE
MCVPTLVAIEQDAEKSTVRHWPVPEDIRSALEVTCRNGMAEAMSHWSVREIVSRYVYLSVADMASMVKLVENHVLLRPLAGRGIELGAGCGLLSAVVARSPSVNSVFALEICQRMAELIVPKVALHVLGSQRAKVVPVVGSFDDIRLPDESLDFAIEHDSLHHSDDLPRTLTECARVLKPGGTVLCLDRCHPNSVSDEQVQRMLSVVYTPDFLAANHYPTDITLTRRDNGEHEYRLFEWQAAIQSAGLKLVSRREFYQRITGVRAIKGILSLLPKPIRRLVYQTDNANLRTTATWLAQRLATAYGNSETAVLAPKRTTILLLAKPESRT